MLEAVQLEAWAALGSNGMNAVAIYLTIVSGYLVVAYTAGSELSKTQLVITSSLFVLFSVFFTMGARIHFKQAEAYSIIIGVNNGDAVATSIFIAQIGGIIAALLFMLSSRKKTKKKNQSGDT